MRFLLILSGENFNQSNNIVYINNTKVRLYLIYKHYIYCGFAFKERGIYEYF